MKGITTLAATHSRSSGWSRYVGMTSEQAYEAFRKEGRRTRALAVGAILVAAILYVGLGGGGVPALVAYLAFAMADAAAVVLLLTRNFQGLLDISNRDCDPQKLMEVIACLQAEDKRGRSANNLALAYAVCSQNLGYDDVALQWLDQVRLKRVHPQVAASMLFVRASVALNRGDVPAASALRGEIASLAAKGKAVRERDLALAMLDARLALAQGDPQAAKGYVVRAATMEPLPVQEVALEYLAGLAEDACGDASAARHHMEVVTANAGTLDIGAKAREFLVGMA